MEPHHRKRNLSIHQKQIRFLMLKAAVLLLAAFTGLGIQPNQSGDPIAPTMIEVYVFHLTSGAEMFIREFKGLTFTTT